MLKQKDTRDTRRSTNEQRKKRQVSPLEKETVEEQASVARQYGGKRRKQGQYADSQANKGENLQSNSGQPVVTATQTSKKTQILNIGDQRVEVINPQYVTELEQRLDNMEKKLKQVENNNRRVHSHANTLTSEINSLKSSMPRWS